MFQYCNPCRNPPYNIGSLGGRVVEGGRTQGDYTLATRLEQFFHTVLQSFIFKNLPWRRSLGGGGRVRPVNRLSMQSSIS